MREREINRKMSHVRGDQYAISTLIYPTSGSHESLAAECLRQQGDAHVNRLPTTTIAFMHSLCGTCHTITTALAVFTERIFSTDPWAV